MIQIFTGDDRIKANQAIRQTLGQDYEIVEGADLTTIDLPTITRGASLFANQRKILIRDLSPNKAVYDQLPDYLDTPHDIILFESRLDKRSSTYKALKTQIKITEFKLPENANFKIVFDIYRTAKRDGKKAVQMLAKIQATEDPIKFAGLLNSQALKDYTAHQGAKEKRTLQELSKLDLALKSTSIQPWLLVQSFLLRVSSL